MLKPPPIAQEVVAAAATAAFGRPLVQNNLRAMLVEAMIDAVLPDTWTWVSADWAECDFRRSDKVRLEVKNSAARQSWASSKPYAGLFDIGARTGRWVNGNEWVAEPGRNAEIYVLAFHPVFDDSADHRNPMQWQFYIVPASALPPIKTISLSRVQKLAQACGVLELAERIEAVANAMTETANA
jgi:hypothetical protein